MTMKISFRDFLGVSPDYQEQYILPPETRILGLVGRIKAGKDTVAKYLSRLSTQYSVIEGCPPSAMDINLNRYQPLSFAEPLKVFASQMYDFPLEWTQTHAGKNQIIPHLNQTVRKVLQDLGVRQRETDPNVWVRLAWKKMFESMRTHSIPYMAGNARFVITDCRFPNEIETILSHPGGCLLYLTRCGEESNHESETNVPKIAEQYKDDPRFIQIDNKAPDYPLETLLKNIDHALHYFDTTLPMLQAIKKPVEINQICCPDNDGKCICCGSCNCGAGEKVIADK